MRHLFFISFKVNYSVNAFILRAVFNAINFSASRLKSQGFLPLIHGS